MNWLDVLVLAVTIPCGLFGFWRGAIRLTFGVLGLIAGVILAGRFSDSLAGEFWPNGHVWASAAAYALILVVSVVLASMLGWLLARFANIILLGWADRLGGLLLGATIGALVCTLGLALAVWAVPATEEAICESTLARFLLKGLGGVLDNLPGRLAPGESLVTWS